MLVHNMTSLLTLNIFILLSLSKARISKYATVARVFDSYNNERNNALHHYKASSIELPYHVLIAYSTLYCSGTLILSKVVVTAATCFVKWQNQRIVVKVGSDTITGFGQVVEAVDLKQHEYFAHNSPIGNDIAIVMLNEHVLFGDKVQKIPLLELNVALPIGTIVTVSGYADQQPQKYANNLLSTEMTIIPDAECLKLYPGLKGNSNFCAKYNAELGLRDNGGPAVFKNVLVGIVSYGAAREEEPFVALLTNVSYFYNWIGLNTKRFMMKYCIDTVHHEYYYDIESGEYQ